ncbi:type II toxin-antitoxin system RelE/ParE family toxin [Marinomonas posidonica]|uniref:Type II toxin-antitoxin system RelE/ParE family toxin n=1 Tax=Marinomonas posidonica (strain CECT 7376 / NCIMB 14433 / IVIA-Po-181) TaxID=491952 RepID=F6CTX4_MARPP|nr:type II toxin-antitoxin system RelE/ParE family toxin [Marinomonas posidonica]AEF56343.1 protein of unknown function DUF1044 [Marinomonas posidonica IVIA-Po-181]
MRIFKNKAFHRWAIKEGLADSALITAVDEIEKGLVDADLGGHVFKKRVALGGRGKSAGARTLLAYRFGQRAFFMYGFAKNSRANIDADELRALRRLAKELLEYSDIELIIAIEHGAFIEVKNNG